MPKMIGIDLLLTLHCKKKEMIITNTEFVAGREIAETVGMVRGSIVRAINIGRDIFPSLKNIVGGEVSYGTAVKLK